MKKKIYLLGMLFAFAACEQDYSELEYKEKPFVAFTATAASVSEGNSAVGNTVKLTVSRATPDLSGALTVTFGATSAKFETTNADASGTFTLSGEGGTTTTVVIPAGKTTATVSLVTVGNTLLQTNRNIDISITGASADLNLGYPGPASIGKTATVTISDDDCIPDISNLLGAYGCVEPGYNNNNPYDVTFSQINCTTIRNSNFWDEGAAINYSVNGLTGAVSISSQPFKSGSGTSYTVSGANGTLNLATGAMTVPYVVKNTAGTTVDSNTHSFTRKP